MSEKSDDDKKEPSPPKPDDDQLSNPITRLQSGDESIIADITSTRRDHTKESDQGRVGDSNQDKSKESGE